MFFKISSRPNSATGKRDVYYRLVESYRNADDRVCHQAIGELGLPSFLRSQGWRDLDIRLAQTMIISRMVHPSSELYMSRWITENSAVCELTGIG